MFVPSGGLTPEQWVRIKLASREGHTVPEETWSENALVGGLATPVLVGDDLYGSTRNNFLGVDIDSGKRLWVRRGFPDATCLHADGKLIILDSDGKLTLATPTRDGLVIHSQYQAAGGNAWTVPTLVGRTLYLRDREDIMALDLGK